MKKKTWVMAGIFLGLCLAAAIFLRFRNQGDQSVAIKPSKDYPAEDVVLYCQKDSAWQNDHLGSSAYTMGGSGCLTSCIASALSTQHEKTGIGYAMTAGELNAWFGEKEVYNGSGDIVWDNIKKAVPEAEVVVASSVKDAEIENLLAAGRYPIVKVKVGGRGAGHWVLLVGSRDGEYICMDPLSESQELVPLSRHGGVVYRMRCVYWRE